MKTATSAAPVLTTEEAVLADLLSDLCLDNEDHSDEVLETAPSDIEVEIEAAAPALVPFEVEEIIEGDEPTDTVEAAPVVDTSADDKAAKKAAKVAEQAAKKIEREAARAAKKAEREAAKVGKPTRKHYASKVERLTDKLGDKLGENTVLEIADAILEGDELVAKQGETLLALKSAGIKVQNRMTFMLEFVAGKSAKLNGVIHTAFALLHKDGQLTTGGKGNVITALLAHPYSDSAAKAMGGNTILAMKALKVIVPTEKGTFVANPDSLILMKINGMIGL